MGEWPDSTYPNQKKLAAYRGPARSAMSKRYSGGTGLGAKRFINFSYAGLYHTRYYTKAKASAFSHQIYSEKYSKLTKTTPPTPPPNKGRNINPDAPAFRWCP